MIKNISFAILCYLMVIGSAISQQRADLNINADWEYLEKPYDSFKEANKSEGWVGIDLPHSWNSEDAVDLIPGYRRSISWYKKRMSFDNLSKEDRYILYFEGANITTEVYVNGQLAGNHIGGYIGFDVEITSFLKEGQNEILVKVDNGYDRQIIPSQTSDFFIYGGITRDVWLKTVPLTYISDIKITPNNVSKKKATTMVNLELNGELSPSHKLKITVKDPQGKVAYETTIRANQESEISFKLKNPMLWGVDNPNLYHLEASLLKGSTTKDKAFEKYGLRFFEFKDHGPFYLNGERLLLRGTHRHEEHAGLGPAMSDKMHRKDIEMIKEMGANFIRLAHYPQDPEIYRACDELGILVWDELPWCRGGVGDDVWKENTTNMLTEIIDQNYNHPSVIIWSLGNEIYWLPDFDNGNDTTAINAYLTELNNLAHKLDPNRKTAIRKYYEGCHIVDVFSPSIWSGWYSGTYKNYETVINQSLEKYPHFLHMEYGGSSHVGRHTENPITGDGFVDPATFEEEVNQIEVKSVAKSGDWSENYIVDLFDWYLSVTENHDQFVGNAQWAFKDFGTPLRPENDIPYINQKGLADRDGNPKDAYYVFKSYWGKEPFAYIESHTWTERSGPEGVKRNISVYSNAPTLELFHNGKSLGKKEKDSKKFPAGGLNWEISFSSGENVLEAKGYKNDKLVAEDELAVNYNFIQAGSPSKLMLSSQKTKNGDYLVTATAVDKKGQRCLNYEERVYFQCLSGGDLHRNQGTPTGSESIKMANGKAAIMVTPGSGSKTIEMTVLNQNFKGTYLTIELLEKHAKVVK